MIKVRTGKSASDNALTPTHTHRNARWRLYRKHSGFPQSRGSFLKTYTEQLQRRKREEKGLVPVLQHFVFAKT